MPNKISTAKQKKLLARMLQLIKGGKISTIDAAAKLEIHTRTFNRLMLEAKVTRPVGARALQDKAAADRKEARTKAAQDVISGKYTIEKAAAIAECSERTVKRYMEALRGS